MSKPLLSTRPLLILAALAALAVASSGCGTTTANVERGRELFKTKCGVCHTLAQAATTAQVGPNLDDAFAAARAAGEDSETIEGIVRAQVEHPRPYTSSSLSAVSMPPNVVEGQDLDDVAAYVGRWAGVPGAEPPKVAGGPGAQVFANNGCASCHTLQAANAGGTTGPPLEKFLIPADNEAKLEEMIVDPNAEIAKGYPAHVMPTNFGEVLSPEELENVIQFLIESTPAGGGSSGGGSKGGGKGA